MLPKTFNHLQTPDENDIELAKESSRLLAACLGEGDSARIRIIDGETEITVPMRAIYMLRDILNEMANGNSVTIRPFHEELTTQEAADFLNVSRPYFTKSILDKGLLPYRKVGVRRKVLFTDLLKFKQEELEKSEGTMEELQAIAQEHDMGY